MDWKDNSISIRRFLLTFLPRWPESTTAMAKTISVFAQSPAWDPDRLQKETAKELEKIKKAIRDADNDVDETVYGGEPLLIYAITRNDTNILDMLLTQYKADPIVYDSKGRSAIEIAIIVGNTDAVKMLLQHSSSPEMMLSQRGTDGDTPIHQVAQRLNLPLLNFFLEHLPTPQMRLTYLNTRNNLRQTPLMRAIHDSHGDEDSILDIVKIIVETMEASVQGTTSSQLSETIRRFIEDDTIEDIVDRPARHILDLRDLSGCTAAVYALRSGYLKVYKYLVEHGSNINAARHDAVVKTVDQLGNKELLEFVTSGATMFDVFETVPVTVQFLNNLAQLTGSAGDNEDTDDRNNIVSSDILAQQIVDAFDYLMKKAAKSPQAKNRRATKTPHFYLLTGGSKRSFGSNDSDPGTSLAHQLGKCMESAIARGNLPLVKYLHETWNVSMQPCGDTEDTGHTVDGINILIDQSAYIPFSISKPIIDYILSQGGSLVPILEYYSNREDNIRDFFSDIEDKNLLMYLLEQVGKVAPKSIKTLFAGAPVHKILRMFWHDVFNSTGSVSADKHRFERYYETLGTIPPYTVPEDEIPAIFEEYVPLLELAITANPESITTKKSEFLAFQSATILMCYLTQARPIMPFIVEWLFEHGAPKDTVDRTLGSVYGATVSNMIYITKKNLSMTQVIDMVKEYRGYFEHLKKLVGNVPAYYNIVTASIHGGRDKETLLDKMLGAAYVEVKLAKNPEFKAWIQDIRDEGALMYEEIQSATKTTETPPESVDSNNKPKKPAPSPYEQYHANIAEKYEDYDDEGNEIERDDD
jgi:ankyrin repeat protein